MRSCQYPLGLLRRSVVLIFQTSLFEVAELYPPQGQWTEADYFALPETNRHLELSDGEFFIPPHPTDTHQRLVFELAILLRRFVDEYDLGTGYGHIALTVDDITATLERLGAEGIEPERPPYTVREGGSLICFVRDPDGYRVELIERP